MFYQSKVDLSARMVQLRNELSEEEYAQFYHDFKHWRHEYGKYYKYNYAWETGLEECLCDIQAENSMCQPDN